MWDLAENMDIVPLRVGFCRLQIPIKAIKTTSAMFEFIAQKTSKMIWHGLIVSGGNEMLSVLQHMLYKKSHLNGEILHGIIKSSPT